ncbi:MAG: GNAT family N-acetyltransferase [Chloroflexota bacterium]
MTEDAARLVVTDAPDRARYEAHLGDALAGFLDYVVKHDRIALVHTEVFPAYEGRGVASGLVRHALDDARSRELRVIPLCEYVRGYLTRHPEDTDIVVGRAPVIPE